MCGGFGFVEGFVEGFESTNKKTGMSLVIINLVYYMPKKYPQPSTGSKPSTNAMF
jgi:hypothetical protein